MYHKAEFVQEWSAKISIMLLEKDMLKQQLNGFGGMFPCNFVGIMVVSRYLPLTRPMTFSCPDE